MKKIFILFIFAFFMFISSVEAAAPLECYYDLNSLSTAISSDTDAPYYNGALRTNIYPSQVLRIYNENRKDGNVYVWEPTVAVGTYSPSGGFTENTQMDFKIESIAQIELTSSNFNTNNNYRARFSVCPDNIYLGLNSLSYQTLQTNLYGIGVISTSSSSSNYNFNLLSTSKIYDGTTPSTPNTPAETCATEMICEYGDENVNYTLSVLNGQMYNQVEILNPLYRYDATTNEFNDITKIMCSTQDGYKCPNYVYYTESLTVVGNDGMGTDYTQTSFAFFRFTRNIANSNWAGMTNYVTGDTNILTLQNAQYDPNLSNSERDQYMQDNYEPTFDNFDPYGIEGQTSSQRINLPGFNLTDASDFKFCAETGLLKTFNILHKLLMIARIVVPLLLVILASIDLFNAFASGDDKAMKASLTVILRRLVIGIIIFFIPTIVNSIIILVDENNDSSGEFSNCTVCFTGKNGNCSDIISDLESENVEGD